ncbi:MADS-box protein AeAP3-2-like [Phoenix dactylifera]|uniref:MADS-box protein AeAP3-2-like n=1 Tax=Phoenix dactylifera TaxID=42345 RepID=A0A8B8ZLR2_PHODC|nr:MADS-box protein AeAP3-2-like [Phoenix dactylifera]
MGRGKIEIKRIENPTNRQVTFSKRRGGLLKKAKELAILCDAQVGVVIFSSSGKMFEYSSAPLSMRQIIDRYQRATSTRFEEIDNQQQIFCEISRVRNENDKLQASMRMYTGEDLSSMTMNDLNQLEQQLEFSVNKVRTRKHQLLNQQLDNLRRKEHILEDQNSHLYRILSEHQVAMEHQQAAIEHKVPDVPMLEPFGLFFQDEPSRNLLQLSPQLHAFRLQPAQPNLQEASLPDHGLQL